MRLDERRQHRINDLHQRALSGKYNWTQLYQCAIRTGVTPGVAKSYIDAVRARLVKAGKVKE